MLRATLTLLSTVVLAIVASLAIAGRGAPQDEGMPLAQAQQILLPAYSVDWDAVPQPPLWCDGPDDPTCAPAAPQAPAPRTVASAPGGAAAAWGQDARPRAGAVRQTQKMTPAATLAPRRGVFSRIDRPPRRQG